MSGGLKPRRGVAEERFDLSALRRAEGWQMSPSYGCGIPAIARARDRSEASMTVTKELTILALTKMHGGVCTAGIDGDGQWVRPVRPHSESKPRCDAVTDYCLLPLDFFHGGHSHLVNLGVTRFSFASHTPQPPHNED